LISLGNIEFTVGQTLKCGNCIILPVGREEEEEKGEEEETEEASLGTSLGLTSQRMIGGEGRGDSMCVYNQTL
jgi:hypothetical protein